MVLFLICMIFPCQVVEVSAVLRSLNHGNAHLVLNGINCGWSLFEAERKQHEKKPEFSVINLFDGAAAAFRKNESCLLSNKKADV